MELLRITNFHPDAGPSVDHVPETYIGYFENAYGEQLIFVHHQGESQATLFHSDLGWQPQAVTGKDWPRHGVILAAEEATWLDACWATIGLRRTPPRQK
jgi:hypothetical protein